MVKNKNSKEMNILDVYARRTGKSHLFLQLEFETENDYHIFIHMSLHRVSKIFYADNKSEAKRLI